ncbi:MAG TPA: 3-hydroxyacyl-CoA dehydrogenase family protein [Candidatus Dormibacteraeota bacterium]
MSPREIASVAVVGAGTMGTQIAFCAALHGYPVHLFSRSDQRLHQGVAEATRILAKRVEKGTLEPRDLEAACARVRPTTDLEEAAGSVDLVIKAIAEERDAKHRVFSQLGGIAREDAILASNSSTMPSSFFRECVPHPERLLNLHFFNPALVMRLVEVVKGEHTAETTAQACMEFARRIGKTPVMVRKATYGFVANRILFIAMQEAFDLVAQGVVAMEDCDLAVRNGLNWPMGPFELADLVGLDITEDILHEGHVQTGEARWAPKPLLRRHVEAGELGRKTGRGFYDYPGA